MNTEREVVVVSAVRTAIGDYGGGLKDQPPTRLGSVVIAEALSRAGVAPADVAHVVFGNVIHTEARDMYLSRVAAVDAGIPVEVPALTLNRLCGSGLQAIVTAAQGILLGDGDVAVAGGAESMSRAQYWAPGARWGQRMGDGQLIDAMVAALSDPFEGVHMGVTAENIAAKWSISRDAQDALAVESHRRAMVAVNEGRFKEQIVPVEIRSKKATTVFDTDEHVRDGVDLAAMAKLRPAFQKDGTVTPGNASGINDAAAAVVLVERALAQQLGLEPLGRLVAWSNAGVEPGEMGIGPVPAVRKLLAATGLTIDDIDVIESNEAFAAQALAVAAELGLPEDRTNTNGGAIALGHPIGASGAILTVKALHELRRTGGRRALVTMCIGGGQGIAALYERI
ncbi:MAG: acetyl-CoA C-acetyltransferase [Actinomycetota bacterium]|jgi:acetyl-CoA C-acetyltransferase|nr:acetyl-CoA C-acetyltransferase [Actinomycetota bacterium]